MTQLWLNLACRSLWCSQSRSLALIPTCSNTFPQSQLSPRSCRDSYSLHVVARILLGLSSFPLWGLGHSLSLHRRCWEHNLSPFWTFLGTPGPLVGLSGEDVTWVPPPFFPSTAQTSHWRPLEHLWLQFPNGLVSCLWLGCLACQGWILKLLPF